MFGSKSHAYNGQLNVTLELAKGGAINRSAQAIRAMMVQYDIAVRDLTVDTKAAPDRQAMTEWMPQHKWLVYRMEFPARYC